ncbi:MAG: hypothetical protein ABWY23_06730 [Mycetocola sp.]
MNFAESLRGLLRRWYIVIPGLLIVASIALGVWFAVPAGYSRSATQLLIPGETSIPEGGNPYLYLGGLSPAADVLVRAIGSENVLNGVVEGRPGTEVEISSAGTGSPIILIEVTASNDATAKDVLTTLVDQTAAILDEIQDVENIPESNRMTVIPVTVDEQGEEEPRSRLLAAAGVGVIGTVVTLLIASFVDGHRRRRDEGYGAAPSEWTDADPGTLDDADPVGSVPTVVTNAARPGGSPTGYPRTDQLPADSTEAEYIPTAPRPRTRW